MTTIPPPPSRGRILLALDPSSTYCGYALMTGPAALLEAGRLKPNKTKDAAINRIPVIASDVQKLIVEFDPTEIVIEVSMSCHGRAGAAGSRTLHVYGMAVGYLWAVCEAAAGARVATVDANRWTRGIPKAKRTAGIAAAFRQYKPAADPGGDIADAIGLGRWYLTETGSFGAKR